MENENIEQEEFDLEDCLSEKEKAKIDGKGFFNKIFKRIRDKRQARDIERFDAMIKNIEEDDISNIIPDEYKK